ncbi:MAG TPA: hypothetical protein VMI92_11920 [Steroidobacteraceae bacterium]|nr:hypothetical protein [Steroidobacteraceae bacterium]
MLFNHNQTGHWRGKTALATALGALGALASQAHADDVTLPPISIGAGMEASYFHCDTSCLYNGSGTGDLDGFALNSARLYINGSVTDTIKMTFNTEYTSENNLEVMDAIARFELSPELNIWAGRFLPPVDRANLYGPYYANDWTPYADGVADYYPNVAVGRDNGIAYWGDFGPVKASFGLFDGQSLNSAVDDPTKLLYAGRVMVDLWDKESGYYLNGTYYGDKDLLAFGVAAQSQDSKTTWSADGLLEKKLGDAGAITVEAEYNKDNGLTGATHSDGWYGLVAYVFPQVVGVGKFQPLVKYSEKTYDATTSFKVKTTEVNFNYIIKAFNARVGLYYLTEKASPSSGSTPSEAGLKLQIQM